MNAKQAKELRRLLNYKPKPINQRHYTKGSDGSIRCTGLRALYLQAKKLVSQGMSPLNAALTVKNAPIRHKSGHTPPDREVNHRRGKSIGDNKGPSEGWRGMDFKDILRG